VNFGDDSFFKKFNTPDLRIQSLGIEMEVQGSVFIEKPYVK